MPKFKVIISLALEVENPCDEDGAWRVHTFSDKGFFDLTSDCNREVFFPLNKGQDGHIAAVGVRSRLKAGTAFIISVEEHSDIIYSIAAKQDDFGHCDGIMVWEGDRRDLPTAYHEREQKAEWFLEHYTEWANGWCYDYEIQDENGKQIYGEANFIGFDSMCKSIRMNLPTGVTKDDVEFEDPFDMVRFCHFFDQEGQLCPP